MRLAKSSILILLPNTCTHEGFVFHPNFDEFIYLIGGELNVRTVFLILFEGFPAFHRLFDIYPSRSYYNSTV